NPATRRSFSLLSSGMVSTYSLKWTPACPGIHRDESASAMSAYVLSDDEVRRDLRRWVPEYQTAVAPVLQSVPSVRVASNG
ncbi:hypothetical protein UE95_040125, partial [Burkholderia cenocepacia]